MDNLVADLGATILQFSEPFYGSTELKKQGQVQGLGEAKSYQSIRSSYYVDDLYFQIISIFNRTFLIRYLRLVYDIKNIRYLRHVYDIKN